MCWNIRLEMVLLLVLCFTQVVSASDNLIAIDVLIKPDAKMVAEAKAWNAKLKEQSPEGFVFDE